MHTSKIPVIGIALFGLVGCLLPWAQTMKFESSSRIGGLCFAEGGLTLAIFFLIALVSFFKTGSGKLLNSYYKTVLLLSSIILAITLFKILNIEAQASKMSSYNIDIKGITQYEPTTGLFISMSAAAAITLYMAVQLILRYRKVLIPESWRSPIPAGRFYLSTHHNTTL